MNIILWIGQGLLAAVFLYSGIQKSTQSLDRMVQTGQTAAKIMPLSVMRTAGITELFGVLGVILPWWTGIARVLTPVSATGFAVIMVLAATVHARLREPRNVVNNAVLFALAVLVAWGRFADL